MMRIGQLAAATGISADAIRLYEARGILKPVRRANGYRAFAPETVGLVHMIRLAQRLGFTLREIEEVMGALQDDDLSADRIRHMLMEKLADVDARIADLQTLRSLLQVRLSDVCGLGLKVRGARG